MTSRSLSPSKIGKFQEMFGAALRKADGLFDDEAQQMIENDWNELEPELKSACVDAVNRVLERKRNTIVRRVKNIQRNRTAEQAIDATGRVKYVDSSVVATMPVGQEPEEAELHYFRLGKLASDDELEREYEGRGLVPDPQAQAADNGQDPSFADLHPNGTHWKDNKGQWCYLAFSRWLVGRSVHCDRSGRGWLGLWWFAGVRKS